MSNPKRIFVSGLFFLNCFIFVQLVDLITAPTTGQAGLSFFFYFVALTIVIEGLALPALIIVLFSRFNDHGWFPSKIFFGLPVYLLINAILPFISIMILAIFRAIN